jgi:hypothetical protein
MQIAGIDRVLQRVHGAASLIRAETGLRQPHEHTAHTWPSPRSTMLTW